MKTLKTLALLIICILLSLPGHTQSMLTDGTTWHYSLTNWWYPYQVDYNLFEINGDSTILNKDCKILIRKVATCDLRSEREYIYEEDSKYYYYDRFNDQFNLLYDFDTQIGDILEIPYWESEIQYLDWQDSLFYIHINAIDSIDFGGRLLKVFYVSYDFEDDSQVDFGSQEDIIIEGIGGMTNLFYRMENGFCDGLFNTELRCFTHPNYGTMSFVDFSCTNTDGPDATEDYSIIENHLTISPNPFSNSINITATNSIMNGELQIYDLVGGLVHAEAINIPAGEQVSIDDFSSPSNLYILKIVDKKGFVWGLEKIVKH